MSNQLHSRLMLGFRHNATVPCKHELLAAIAHYLNLDNWADLQAHPVVAEYKPHSPSCPFTTPADSQATWQHFPNLG